MTDLLPHNNRRTLYPLVEPYASGMLEVGDGHKLYWERVGTPGAKPAVFLHGGPGAGASPRHRGQWHPQKYDVLLFDQRGAGRSTPHACLDANTTPHLVADIERLRAMAGVERWQVFGGSWGSTLALAYAQAHPERVSELILRGIFLFDQGEIDWLYRPGGAALLYPDKWESFIVPVAEAAARGDDLVEAYRRLLTGDDAAARLAAAKAWSRWEGEVVTLLPDAETLSHSVEDDFAVAIARIENHYMAHHGWLAEGELLAGTGRLRDIPGVIVQGRHDCCTPPAAAWALHKAWPEAAIEIVADGGHSFSEPGILDALVRATDGFADRAG